MANIFFDIETLPDMRPGAREQFIEAARENIKVPAGSTKESLAADLGITDKDEIKFTPRASLDARWVAEVGPTQAEPIGDAEWRKTSFDGSRGQVLMIGIAVDDAPPVVFSEPTESGTLSAFFEAVMLAYNPTRDPRPAFVGHNIVGFDLRFILHRSIILGVRPPMIIPFDARPWDDSAYDTMVRWAGVGNRIKLDSLAKALGVQGKGDVDGSMVYDLYAAGEIDKLIDYCGDDVRMTRDVWRRMTFANFDRRLARPDLALAEATA